MLENHLVMIQILFVFAFLKNSLFLLQIFEENNLNKKNNYFHILDYEYFYLNFYLILLIFFPIMMVYLHNISY